MKNNSLFEALSTIDDNLIAEADPTVTVKMKFPWKKLAVSVVSACFVLALVIPAIYFASLGGHGTPTTTGTPYSPNPQPEQNAPCTTASAPEINAPEGGIGEADDWGSLAPMEPSGSTGDSYTEFVENGFVNASENNKSFFSIDVSTASYPNVRATLKKGIMPQKNAFRVEEILNYFRYDYKAPNAGEDFSLSASMFPTPYNPATQLLTVGLAAKAVEFDNVQNNLVFLIDVSGSMYADNKLPLAQKAFTMLAENLNPTDRVSIVTYANGDAVALSGAYGHETKKIVSVIEDLQAGGSTAGSKGIETAYQLAGKYFIEGGNNRVILMTDGDFNVGISSVEGLKSFISEKRSSGVYFSVYGFGMGNWQSDKMEALALAGNGAYGYIDSELEAKRALVDEIGGSLVTVAKDVKAGIEFNADYIKRYRLVGYETKQMTEDEFNDSEKDAGEIGSGHTITLVYEIELTDKALVSGESFGNITLKYKTPDTSEEREMSLEVKTDVYHSEPTANDAFVAAVVEFVLLARDSAYKADATLAELIARLDELDLSSDAFKAEFRDIVKLYATLASN